MTIGYSAAGQCWPTTAEAVDAYYSATLAHGVTVANPGDGATAAAVLVPVKSGGVWSMSRNRCDEIYNQCSTKYTPLPTNVYGTCTLAESSGSSSVPTGLPADFDYTILGALFAFSFSVVVGLWLFGRSAGSIVNIFKPK